MVEIQSKEVIDKISDDLKIQPSMTIPRELMKQIQLSYNVNPVRKPRFTFGSVSDGTSATIFTTSLVKDTWIMGAHLAVTKDVNSISTSTTVQVISVDSSGAFLRIAYEPATAGNHVSSIMLSKPMLLRRGSVVTVNNSNGTASIDAAATIYFYETDPE